jgi:hypothetical protein
MDEPTKDTGRAGPAGAAERQRRRADMIEEAIRRGIADGAFEDLPGKGQPLKWETATDDEWWLANHMLRSAGYTPEWIDRSKRIRDQRAALERQLRDFEAWASRQPLDRPVAEIERAKRSREASFREGATRLNLEIDAYNVICPVPTARIMRIRIDAELDAFRERLAHGTGRPTPPPEA